MKLTDFLSEAKRGDKIYVIYDVSSSDVISTTTNPKKLTEIISNATGIYHENSDLARVELKGKDDFGKGPNKVKVFKSIIL